MSKRNVEIVSEKMSNCKRCENSCPCQALSDYINKVGIIEFNNQYESNTLPEEIKGIYESKLKKLNL